MLCKFAVTNYRGFEQRIEWDLTKARDYAFNTFAIKNKIIKNGIIYGPNGSGKSNFGLAIFDIVNHLSQKWKKADYYKNFVCAGNQKSNVDFEYVFNFNNQIIKYNYSKNAQGFLQAEKLVVDEKNIFERNLGSFSINHEEFPMDERIQNNLANNANNVSIVSFLLTSYPLADDSYLMQLQNFVNSMLWFRSLDVREFIGLETNVLFIDEYIIKNNLVKDFQTFIEQVSNQKFSFVKPNQNDKHLFCYIKGVPIQFNLIKSTGTDSLMLLYFWYKQMEKASFVFIDEFDAFYHFKLSKNICRKLFELNCQLFLTSHNTLLLCNDLLRPDCNFLLDKNVIRAIHDCTDKELREGHNIEKLFRGGTFD